MFWRRDTGCREILCLAFSSQCLPAADRDRSADCQQDMSGQREDNPPAAPTLSSDTRLRSHHECGGWVASFSLKMNTITGWGACWEGDKLAMCLCVCWGRGGMLMLVALTYTTALCESVNDNKRFWRGHDELQR